MSVESLTKRSLWVCFFIMPLVLGFTYFCEGGSISGAITVDPTREPIEGVKIEVCGLVDECKYGWSDAAGHYTVDDLATSDYVVWTWNDQGYVNELYPGVIYCGFPPIGAEAVHVESPNNTPNINFALAKPEGSISGRVTSALTGKPIEGVTVTACSGWCLCRDSLTGVDGNYTVSGLATEDYALYTSNEQGYFDEWYQKIVYKGSRRPPDVELVPVNSPNNTPDINFVLQVGGSIRGKVFDDITSLGIEGLMVAAYGGDGFDKEIQTDDSGNYIISGLGSGKYLVSVYNENDLTYPFYEYYNNAANYTDEKIELVEVVVGSTTGNIDFGMPFAQSISGNISGIDGETEVCIGLTEAGFPFGGFQGGEICRVGPGNYSIPGLHPDGDYLAFSLLGALGYLYFDDTLSPSLAETVNPPRDDIDFNLNLSGCIEGQLIDFSNVPIADVGIALYDNETGKLETAISSGSSGSYKFDYLPPKTYQVKVISDSYCSQVKTAEVDSGCIDVNFQLEACTIPCLTLAAGEGSGQVGERVTIPILIDNLQDQSAGILARFFFDKNKMELSNIRSEAVDIDFYSSPTWEPNLNGYFIIYATFGVAAVGSPILANLDFTILSGTPGEEILLEIITASTSVCETADGKIIVSDTANVSFEIEADSLDINCEGKVRARVLGVDHFNVRTIDPDFLRLTREGTENGVVPVRYSYTTGGKKATEDMVLIFSLPEMVESLMLNEVEGQDIPLILTGQTTDGSPLRGQDHVMLLGGIEKECKSDFDCDADVDGKDALTFKDNFGRSTLQNPCSDEEPCDGNYDGDSDVDGDDAFKFKSEYGTILY